MPNFDDNPFQEKTAQDVDLKFKRKTSQDDILKNFGCDTDEITCGINTDEDYRIQIVSPSNPLGPINLEYRNNWEIVEVEGVDEMADIELSTETSKYRDGVRIKGSRKKERTIRIVLKVCPCEECDFLTQRRELYELIDCRGCNLDQCNYCCQNGELCFDDYAMKDLRYCHLRIKCCDVVRQIPVTRTGGVKIEKRGTCIYYTITYLAELPNYHFPRIQTQEITINEDGTDGTELICPDKLFGDVNLSQIYSFKKCVAIPYTGTVDGYAKITIRGPVTNLKIENVDTGAFIDLNQRQNYYTIDGCGATVLNFFRGQQSYTDDFQQSIYSDLSGGCVNQFVLPANCGGEVNLCITGDLVDPKRFFMKIQWWLEYDGFFALEDEPELTTVQTDKCGSCVQTQIIEPTSADFSETVVLPYSGKTVSFPRFISTGAYTTLTVTEPATGKSWDFSSDQATQFALCCKSLLNFMGYEATTTTTGECSPTTITTLPEPALGFTGDTTLTFAGTGITPGDFQIEAIWFCEEITDPVTGDAC